MATLSTVISYGEPTGTIVTEIGTPGPTGQTGPVGPAGPTFTGGPITSPITYTVGTNTTVFENGDIYTENTATGAYGVVYINGLEASDGTNTLAMTASGITFGDSSFQSTAFPGSAAFYPSTGNPSGFLTDAPSDGSQYARQDGAWSVVTGGGGGSYLPLAGGTMTGPIVFDGTSGQYISKGNFDTSRGGNYGISLVCSIGYEFNWQAGWLTTTEQSSVTPRPLYLDSLAGTTLRAWNSAADNGVEVSHTGINVANATPYYVNVAPDLVKVFESTNELGVSIAHDSIAIQHIDTPNVTSYFTNEYIGFEDLGGTPHSSWIEHDVITVQDETNTTQMRSTGISLSAAGSITFGDSTVQTTSATNLGFITQGTADGLYYAIGNPSGFVDAGYVGSQGFITSSALTPYAPLDGATFTGQVVFPASTTTVSSFRIPAYVDPVTSPSVGDIWNTGSVLQVATSTTNETIAYQSWVTGLGYLTSTQAALNYAPLVSPVFTGDARAVTPATSDNDTSIATTAFVKAQGYLTSAPVTSVAGRTGAITLAVADVSGAAALASPSLTGVPVAPTATVSTNTTQLATTAFVLGQVGTATPIVNGTAAVGSSWLYARQDHVHPTDTSRAALASPTFTGTPLSTTAAVDTNTTQIATTAYVIGQGYAKLASPTFTGTPTLPTGTIATTQTAGNNTTAVATTAFVTAAVPAFAALTDVIANPSVATTNLNPSLIPWLMANANVRYFGRLGFTSVVGGGTGEYGMTREVYTTAASQRATFMDSLYGFASYGMRSASDVANINFSKKLWLFGVYFPSAGNTGTSYYGDANTVSRINIGGRSANATGGLTDKGVGLFKVGGTGTAINLTVHNGTTLTSVSSGITNASGQSFKYLIYSDGAGNVTLYINGTSVATTSLGPTGSTASGYSIYEEQVETSATFSVRQGMIVTGAGLIIER